MTNALLTPPKQLDLKKIRVFRLIDGSTIIAILVGSDDLVVQLSGAVTLKEMRDSETGTISGFITEPFMAPYITFDPEKILKLNIHQLLCATDPNDFVRERYATIMEAALNQTSPSAAIASLEAEAEENAKIDGEDPLYSPKKGLLH
jgi:hypothetical protein